MTTVEETNKVLMFKSSFTYRVDTSKVNYSGPLTQISDEKKSFLFNVESPSFYSSLFVLSHEGNTDYQLMFGNVAVGQTGFKVDMVIVFSFAEILRFVDFLEQIIGDQQYQPKQVKKEPKDVKVQMLQPMVFPNTIFFAPNSYFVLGQGETNEVFFGRKIGKMNNIPASFMFNSIIVSNQTISDLINVIKNDVKKLEGEYGVKLSEFTLGKEEDR